MHLKPFKSRLNELLSTQNVNVARFARNVSDDFFVGSFETDEFLDIVFLAW